MMKRNQIKQNQRESAASSVKKKKALRCDQQRQMMAAQPQVVATIKIRTFLGVSILPATNPLEIAKGMALLLAPVEIPISIACPMTRALLCPIFVGVMN